MKVGLQMLVLPVSCAFQSCMEAGILVLPKLAKLRSILKGKFVELCKFFCTQTNEHNVAMDTWKTVEPIPEQADAIFDEEIEPYIPFKSGKRV